MEKLKGKQKCGSGYAANIWELLSDKVRLRKEQQPQKTMSFKEATVTLGPRF